MRFLLPVFFLFTVSSFALPVDLCLKELSNQRPFHIRQAQIVLEDFFSQNREYEINWSLTDRILFPIKSKSIKRESVHLTGGELFTNMEFSETNDWSAFEETLINVSPLDGLMSKDVTRLYIDLYKVSKRHRGQGLSEVLIAKQLLYYPSLKTISAEFGMTNAKIYWKNYHETQDELYSARQTPLAKTLLKFGFKLAEVEMRRNVHTSVHVRFINIK